MPEWGDQLEANRQAVHRFGRQNQRRNAGRIDEPGECALMRRPPLSKHGRRGARR